MSLANKTCWVVGGVGVVGKSIARSLLRSGATVIVNSRSSARLESLRIDLGDHERLKTVHGSLLPGHSAKTVNETLNSMSLHHVVAHGTVRWWAANKEGIDETYSLNKATGGISGRLLESMTCEEFSQSSSQLATLHFSAAQSLFPRLQFSEGGGRSYTFVTGDGSGKPGGHRSSMAEINSYHLWGLSAAMRHENYLLEEKGRTSDQGSNVIVREIRVELAVNRSQEEIEKNPRDWKLSELTGDICAGIISKAPVSVDVFKIDSPEKLLTYHNEFC